MRGATRDNSSSTRLTAIFPAEHHFDDVHGMRMASLSAACAAVDQIGFRLLPRAQKLCRFPLRHQNLEPLRVRQFANMNNPRNLFIVGFALYMGLSVPAFFTQFAAGNAEGRYPVNTGSTTVRTSLGIYSSG